MATERPHDDKAKRPYDTTPVGDGPRAGENGPTYLNELLARGRPDPVEVAHLIRAFSVNGFGHEMYDVLQKRLGNAYVQEVVAVLQREQAAPQPSPTAPSPEHHKYALLAGGAEKDSDPAYPDPPDYRGMDYFSPTMLQAMPFFTEHGYDTRVLFGDSPKPVDPAQAPGLGELQHEAAQHKVPVEAFNRQTLTKELAAIAEAVQPGDEVMLMIASHGYAKGENEAIPNFNWNDPKSGHYMFLSGHQEMHLDELAPFRDLIEKKGGKLAILLMTCTSQFGLQFASSSGQTSVVSETGTDKGDSDFATSFFANLQPGMTLDEAFATGKQLMHHGVDDPHISTEVTGKPSAFRF